MDALETPDIRADGIDQDRATLSVVLEDCAGEPPGVGGQVGERYDRCSGDEVGGWRQVELPLAHLVRGEREVLVQADQLIYTKILQVSLQSSGAEVAEPSTAH